MSGVTVQNCATLFDNGRYGDCINCVAALPPQERNPSVLLMVLACRQRMNDSKAAAAFGDQLLATTKKDRWWQALVRLTIGTASFDEVRQLAGTDKLRICQFCYYAGSRLMTQGSYNDAQEAFDQCLYTHADCLESTLAYFQITTIAPRTRYPSQALMGIYINMLRQIESYLEHGQTSQADELATSLVHLTHRDLATHPQELADCLVRIANAFRFTGSPEKALPLFEEAVPLMRTAPDRDSESFSESVEALGNLYYERAMYEKAKPLLREALDLYRATAGEDDASCVRCLNNLAAIHMLLSETESAASLLEQALAIKARTIGTRHPSYATSIHNLAVAKQQSGDLVRAEELYREEIDILRAAGEENSEDCTLALHALAEVCTALGKHEEAEQLLLRAVESADVHSKG